MAVIYQSKVSWDQPCATEQCDPSDIRVGDDIYQGPLVWGVTAIECTESDQGDTYFATLTRGAKSERTFWVEDWSKIIRCK